MYFLKKRVAKSIIGMCVCVVMVAKNIKYFFATLATTFFATLEIYYYKIKYSKYSVINKNFTAYYQKFLRLFNYDCYWIGNIWINRKFMGWKMFPFGFYPLLYWILLAHHFHWKFQLYQSHSIVVVVTCTHFILFIAFYVCLSYISLL